MGLKTWARGEVFKRVADALEHPSINGSFLGWNMDKWKPWAEGLLWAVVGAVGGAIADAVQSGQPLTLASFKSTALASAVLAAAAYLRKSPSDPRRETSNPTPGQLVDMASRVKEEEVIPEWKKIGEVPEVKVIPKAETPAPKPVDPTPGLLDIKSKAIFTVGTKILLQDGREAVVMLTKESSGTGFTYGVKVL